MKKQVKFGGKLMSKSDARKLWLAQRDTVRCACGCHASFGRYGRDTITGTAGNNPTEAIKEEMK